MSNERKPCIVSVKLGRQSIDSEEEGRIYFSVDQAKKLTDALMQEKEIEIRVGHHLVQFRIVRDDEQEGDRKEWI